MKSVKFNPLASLVMAAALTVGLAGCGGSSNTTPEPATPEPVQPPPPSDLEVTQSDAAEAAMAAKAASDAAAAAASDAEAAIMHIADIQTDQSAKKAEMDARKYAEMAMTAYKDAKEASDAAAAATTGDAAEAAWRDAVDAQEAAEAAADTAGEKSMMAIRAAMMELKIDGTMKSVGGTTVDAGAPNTVITTGSGATERKVETGLIDEPTTVGPGTLGRAPVAEDIQTAAEEYKSPVANAAMRPLKIGKTVDSADDMARLRIVTKYAGSQTVRVFARATAANTALDATEPGVVMIEINGTLTARTLKSEGMYWQLETVAGAAQETLEASNVTDPSGGPPADTATGVHVKSDAKPTTVFSYLDASNAKQYVVLHAVNEVKGGDTTYQYANADIHVDTNPTGRTADANTPTVVTAVVPAAMDYSHVHFGVWAALGEAAKDGAQGIASLGIGFVQNVGAGPTRASDMHDLPAGSATYSGNWVAAVREAHTEGKGGLSLADGGATLSADFSKGEITADLVGLAKLEGSITKNSFSGEKATVGTNSHGLTSGGTFNGMFNGMFYGDEAAEAGGVFDFTSKDMAAGAFTGAFGGAKDE